MLKLSTHDVVFSTVCLHFTRSCAQRISWPSVLFVSFSHLIQAYPSHWASSSRYSCPSSFSRTMCFFFYMCKELQYSLIAQGGQPFMNSELIENRPISSFLHSQYPQPLLYIHISKASIHLRSSTYLQLLIFYLRFCNLGP